MKNTKIYQSPTVVIGFVLFLSLVIATIYRINIAFETHPGLVHIDPYHAGKDYGKIQAMQKSLKNQGYALSFKKHNFIEENKDFNYQAILTHNNQLVKNAKVSFYFYRTLEKDYDFEKNAHFDGKSWNLITKLNRKGKWRVVVKAVFGENTLYAYDKLYVNNALK